MRLIDADALMEDLEYDVELDARQLDDMDFVGIEREHVQIDKDCKQNCIDLLQHTPTIEERKKGKWEHGRETSRLYQGKELVGIMYEDWHCSECGLAFERSEKPIHNFCPNCGADMREVKR